MAHFFQVLPWQMRTLTPFEHDRLVEQTRRELDAIAAAQRGSRRS
jgi:hypothetical protein